jgi:hypothetical protein
MLRHEMSSGPDATPSGPGPVPSDDATPGLGAQFGRTRAAFARLIRAHVELLKAELGEIVGIVGGMVAKGALAFGLATLMGIMLYVGGFLFIGEWLFGSIGWGLAHGTLLPIAGIVALILGVVGGTRGPALFSLFIATLLVVALGLLLGTNLLHSSAESLAGVLAPPLDSPAIVGTLSGLILIGLLLASLFWRLAGFGGALFGLFLGGLIGALLGFGFAADDWSWPPAIGLAISIGLIAWPILNIVFTWPRLDVEAHFNRLAPRQTMAAFEETRTWMEEQWASRSPKLGRK